MTATTARIKTQYAVAFPPHIDRVLQAVADAFCVSVYELLGGSRTRRVSEARQAAMVLLHEMSRMSSLEIGLTFGRDHTTVLWGYQQVERRCGEDGEYRWMFEQAKAALKRGTE